MGGTMLVEIKSFRELTAIQKYLAVKLKNEGFAQNTIAQKLSVTPSCVNQYLSDKRGNKIPLSEVADKVSILFGKLKKGEKTRLLTMLKVGWEE